MSSTGKTGMVTRFVAWLGYRYQRWLQLERVA
jgi:hypothetical protein